MKVGDKAPVVLDGGKVAGGHDGGPLPKDGIEIKAGKLRGISSAGMMCSVEELGSSRRCIRKRLKAVSIFLKRMRKWARMLWTCAGASRSTVFEYEITSNRVDCYGILGIAREAVQHSESPSAHRR